MMNIQAIEDSYFLEDKYNSAIEAERGANVLGDTELAKAYGMISDLLHELKLLKDDMND